MLAVNTGSDGAVKIKRSQTTLAGQMSDLLRKCAKNTAVLWPAILKGQHTEGLFQVRPKVQVDQRMRNF